METLTGQGPDGSDAAGQGARGSNDKKSASRRGRGRRRHVSARARRRGRQHPQPHEVRAGQGRVRDVGDAKRSRSYAAGVRPRESRSVENGRRRRGSETGKDTAPARHRGPGGGGRHQAKADGQVSPHEVRVDVLHRGAGVGGEDRGSTAGAEEPEEPQETKEADGGG